VAGGIKVEDVKANEKSREDTFIYTVAGWMAFASATLLVPYVVLSLIIDFNPRATHTLLPIIVLIAIIQIACSIFAFIMFRNLLNERYNFHDIDNLVPILIFGGIFIFVVAIAGRAFPALKIPALVLLILSAIPVSIVGILYGVRLLRLKAKLHGLLKPLAYSHIIGSIFFLTLILSVLGLLTMAAFDVMLGLLFLQGREEDEEVDFV
jgi:hypothetical protein